MPPEITALIEKPHLLAAVLAVGFLVGMTVGQAVSQMRRQAWRERNRWRWERRRTDERFGRPTVVTADTGSQRLNATDQLRIVLGAKFTIQPLLNRSEMRVFKELDRTVLGYNPSWQVMAQVSLGEILRSEDTIAFSCINSKRVDLLLVDENCRPRHAVEYQGGAHHQGSAAARDAVKREALRKAGIGYHEVVAGFTTPSELRRLAEKLVDKPAAPQ
jgi:hypothetical protein